MLPTGTATGPEPPLELLGGDAHTAAHAQGFLGAIHEGSLRGSTIYAASMTGHEWIIAFAAELGLEPLDSTDIDALLDLAGVAAHASERLAAPLTCYLAAVAGISPVEALARARALAEA